MREAPKYEHYEERFVQAGMHRTRYLEAGPVDAECIVLVHDGAFGTDAELCWHAVVRQLATDYHVYAPELLGWAGTAKVIDFGRSRYENQIEHLAAFCRSVAVESTVFVGTSFGGSLVVRAAADGSGCRLPMRAAVSLSGTGGPFRRHDAVMALGEYVPTLEGAESVSRLIMQPAEPTRGHIERRYAGSLTHGHWESLKAQQLRNPAARSAVRTGGAVGLRARRFPETFAGIDVPVVLVEGIHDPINERGWAGQVAKLSPLASVVELPSGHSPNLDRPVDVANIVGGVMRKNFTDTVDAV